MDYLAKRNLIKPEKRANLLGNRLVLIAPANSAAKLAIGPNFPLAQALGNGRLAIADPNGVPVGRYGKAALESPNVGTRVERSSRSNLSRWPVPAEANRAECSLFSMRSRSNPEGPNSEVTVVPVAAL